MSTSDGSTAEYTGKDVSYYLVRIESPKRLDPYDAECEDIIEALGMTFAEGCAFKAIWRKCAARTLGIAKAGYKGGLYDAEKAEYYGARMVASELRAATVKESLTVHPAGGFAYHFDPMTPPPSFGQQNMIDPAEVDIESADDRLDREYSRIVAEQDEPASAIDDDSERMQAIGNDGEHYGAPDWSKAPDGAVVYIDWTGSASRFKPSFYSDGEYRFYRMDGSAITAGYVPKMDNGLPDIDYPYYMRPAK